MPVATAKPTRIPPAAWDALVRAASPEDAAEAAHAVVVALRHLARSDLPRVSFAAAKLLVRPLCARMRHRYAVPDDFVGDDDLFPTDMPAFDDDWFADDETAAGLGDSTGPTKTSTPHQGERGGDVD